MARLKCTECGVGVSKADPVCRSCGSSLLEDGATAEIPLAAQPLVSVPSLQPTADAAPDRTPARCPNPDCGADIPDPRNLVCIECMTELRPAAPQTAEPAAPGAPAPPPAAEGDNPYATVHERGGARLVVSFDFGHVELSAGQEVMIGRDATDQQLARLNDMMNVSRLARDDRPGSAWCLDTRRKLHQWHVRQRAARQSRRDRGSRRGRRTEASLRCPRHRPIPQAGRIRT